MNRKHLIRHPLIIAIAVIWILGRVFFMAHTTADVQLVTMGLTIVFVGAIAASVVALVREWRTLSWVAALPLAACLAAVPVSSIAGDAARAMQFAMALPDYEKVVARQDVQALQPGARIESLDLSPSERSGIDWAGAQRTPGGMLVVEFATGSGFPVKHSGYVYTSTETVTGGLATQKTWPYQSPVRAHWYEVSN